MPREDPPLGSRTYRAVRDTYRGEEVVRIIFEHAPKERYMLDPELSVVLEDEDGRLRVMMASEAAFVRLPDPRIFMTEKEREEERALHGHSGRLESRQTHGKEAPHPQ